MATREHTSAVASPEHPQEAGALPILVGGKWSAAKVQQHDPVYEPASGKVLARVPMCGAAEVDAAATAALRAFPQWRETPVTQRVQFLFRYKQLLEEHFEELARSVARENGKVIDDARLETRRGIEVVDFACGMPTLMMGDGLEQISHGIDSHT
ncbi:MAG TPA: aldehyde dehydrogenase family protein, partial [Gemmatimonadales bacterium]